MIGFSTFQINGGGTKETYNETPNECLMNKLCMSSFYSDRMQKSRNVDNDGSSGGDDDFDDDLSDDAVPDEAFYYTEIEAEIETEELNIMSPNPPSPPTLSHRDMARPPHEDPEYQRRLVGNMRFVYQYIN